MNRERPLQPPAHVGLDIDVDRVLDELFQLERPLRRGTEPTRLPIDDEPNVWVDATLYVERPPSRLANGTKPAPTCVGAYCVLEQHEPEQPASAVCESAVPSTVEG